jgi:hypothetical protein
LLRRAFGDTIVGMPAPTAAFAALLTALFLCVPLASAQQQEPPPPITPPITFNKNFDGASLGKIETIAPASYRCAVEGQYDQRGHNRQTSWFYFRMDHVRGRDVTITLHDFVGEYNDKPGAVPMGPDIVPVFSNDGQTWRHLPDTAAAWDAEKKELTLTFKPEADSIWIAHVPPYTPRDLQRLLADVERSPHARIEVIGKTALGRDMQMVTVTDPAVSDAQKKVVWLQARQHAWEAGTSYVAEGALRFITSDDPKAVELRRRVIFRFTPMVDPDGCATGKVRFNANGYDVNRHWREVDLRGKEFLRLMPEIWYTKKAIVSAGRIDLMVNLHNTETTEFLDTQADDPQTLKLMQRFYDLLVGRSSFDPSRKLTHSKAKIDDTNTLFAEHHVPVMLMEQRIATSKKLGRRPTVEDRLKFGRELITVMGDVVLE